MKIKQDMILEFIDKELVSSVESIINKIPNKEGGLADQVFNLAYEFFSRYYSNGDFIPQNRYGGRDKYMIPYNGQEVELYWATRNAYYVKTMEYFTNYSFVVSDPFSPEYRYRVNFKIREADLEKNYVVSEKKYFFLDDNPIEDYERGVNIFFNYRPMKEDENIVLQGNEKTIIDTLKQEAEDYILKEVTAELREILSRDSMEKKDERSIIRRHLDIYFKKNESDYFIIKNLKGFLYSELENFIKNEILNLDDGFDVPENSRYIAKAISSLCKKIIDQISQIEDFERKLWEKRKFAYNVNYVITLDRIAGKNHGIDLVKKLMESTGFDQQVEEWSSLGVINGDFSKNELVINTINSYKLNEKYKFLPLDTKYFKELQLEILSLFDNLDEELDGWLIHSENYQALNTLLPKFNKSVQTIYIDPPFNTGKDFLFRDNYQDSTWLTLMENRLELGKKFLRDDGSIYLHLDHISEHYGKLLLDRIFGINNFQAKITWNTGENISGFKSQSMNWIRQADFLQFYSNSRKFKFTKVYEPLAKDNYPYGWLDILGSDKENLFIEIFENGDLVKKNISIEVKPKGTIWNDVYSFQYSEPRITESLGFISNQKPENLLRRIIQSSSEKGDIILDFFLGIGTTTAVAHKLKRKWIGVEIGGFFKETYIDQIEVKNSQISMINEKAIINIVLEKKESKVISVKKLGLLGRMKIVLSGDSEFFAIHSKQKRKPHLSRDIKWLGGGFFKYCDLEQYEDSLNNIRISDQNLDKIKTHLLRYILKFGTLNSQIFVNREVLSDPFNFNMKTVESGVEKEVTIDLVETFNLWHGVSVERILSFKDGDRKYIFVSGRKDMNRLLTIWRNAINLNYERDRDFMLNILKDKFNIEDNKTEFDQILVNSDCVLDLSNYNLEIRSLDPILFKLQWGM